MPINGVWHSFANFYQDVDILDNKEVFFQKSIKLILGKKTYFRRLLK